MSDKTTPWFPASVTPVRVGLYQVQHELWDENPTPYSYWDGKTFNSIYCNPHLAYRERGFDGAGPDVTAWRGLAESTS
jgi:hypothetical protein